LARTPAPPPLIGWGVTLRPRKRRYRRTAYAWVTDLCRVWDFRRTVGPCPGLRAALRHVLALRAELDHDPGDGRRERDHGNDEHGEADQSEDGLHDRPRIAACHAPA